MLREGLIVSERVEFLFKLGNAGPVLIGTTLCRQMDLGELETQINGGG